jgi:FixJ family two-component response regulator
MARVNANAFDIQGRFRVGPTASKASRAGAVDDIAIPLNLLSRRERDVMERVLDGLTNKQIGLELKISPRTVEVYRAAVMRKMRAPNLIGLIRIGFASGLM